MSYRKELEKKIEKKRAEISEWERLISDTKSFIDGLQEALKLAPPDDGEVAPYKLREGSDMDKARKILQAHGKPMHIDEIVKLMDKQFTDSTRNGLAGSLGYYANKRRVFTKTAPKTFGLIEFDAPPVVSQPDII